MRAVPFRANPAGVGLLPLRPARKPKLTVPAGAIVALQPAFVMSTGLPDRAQAFDAQRWRAEKVSRLASQTHNMEWR